MLITIRQEQIASHRLHPSYLIRIFFSKSRDVHTPANIITILNFEVIFHPLHQREPDQYW